MSYKLRDTATSTTQSAKPTHRYKPGDIVRFPTFEELEKNGWVFDPTYGAMYKSGVGACITMTMISIFQNQQLEIKDYRQAGCYSIRNARGGIWPLDFIGPATPATSDTHVCWPGQTPIDGWEICGGCGKNLRRCGS